MLLNKEGYQRRHIPVHALCTVNGLCDGQVFQSNSLDAAGLILANVFASLRVERDTFPLDDVLFTGQIVLRSRAGDNPVGLATLGGGIYGQGSNVVYTGPGTYALPLMVARTHLAEAIEFVIVCLQEVPNRIIEFTTDGQIVAGIGRL